MKAVEESYSYNPGCGDPCKTPFFGGCPLDRKLPMVTDWVFDPQPLHLLCLLTVEYSFVPSGYATLTREQYLGRLLSRSKGSVFLFVFGLMKDRIF